MGFGDKDYCAANDVGFRAEQVQLTRGGGGGGGEGEGGEGTGGGRRESQREHNRKWSELLADTLEAHKERGADDGILLWDTWA